MTTLLIISAIVLGFIGYVFFNFKKMKNMPIAADHAKIKILNSKNFKNQVGKGIVMVDFWAPWCGPCKMMAPVLNDIAETDSDKVTVTKVNVDKEQALAQQFKIRSIPTLILFKNGKEIKRYAGIKTKNFLLKEVNDL